MTNPHTASLEPVGNANLVLEKVDIQATLRGLYGEVEVAQTYRNSDVINIEAVYTFPLPLNAVLLELNLELNGKSLRGIVKKKAVGEETYEDAIAEGDSAVLLEQSAPGLFTMNLANLMPGEQAIVKYRYAQLLTPQGDELRFFLPTTIAPRYGDPSSAGLAAHQIPEWSLQADRGFSLAVRIEGALAENPLECPSHAVAISAAKNSKSIVLAGGSAIMDRDFVLQLKMANDTQVESFYARDEDNYVALASFKPVFNADIAQASRCIKLVVDCSGSMAGDSIYQAKSALREIFLLLKPKDYFNLVTFGNSSQTLFPTVMPASAENLAVATRYVEQIDANMGGTELASALNKAFLSGSIEGTPSDVMLITDGEVWNQEELLSSAEKADHRIFTVGVGSAVSEAILKNLADRTDGACELVSPNENMAQHIVRHYLRINQPKAKSMDLSWPCPTINQAPSEFTTVYAGDTIHVFGWLAERPKGVVKMTMTLENGQVFSQESELIEAAESGDSLNNNLPRLGIYNLLESRAYIEKVDTDEIANMAEKYQLITEHTNCVLVYERDETEKSLNIPAVRKVPQVTAAGGQGFGTVKARRVQILERCVKYDLNLDIPKFLRGSSYDTQHKITRDLKQTPKDTDVGKHAYRRPIETDNYSILVTRVNEKYPSDLSKQLDIETIADLVALGLDERDAEFLSGFTDLIQEKEIVLCFLSALVRSRYKQSFSKQARRVIERANSEYSAPSYIVESIEEYLNTAVAFL